MSDSGSPDLAGCRLFVAPSGRSGFALGMQSGRFGGLFAFFVSPDEDEGTAEHLIALAIQEGASHLVTYADPLLEHWFGRCGFEPSARVPKEATPEREADLLYMVRLGGEPVQAGAARKKRGARQTHCGRCGESVAQRVNVHESVGGYGCGHCGFISVYGMLTLPPRRP